MSKGDASDGAPQSHNLDTGPTSVARRRLRGLRVHMIGFFCLMTVIVPINLLTTPEHPWFVWPLLGWGGVLALHTAWTMGLFDILFGDR